MDTWSAVLAGMALIIALLLALLILARQSKPKFSIDAALESRLRELTAAQNEIAGRIGQAMEAQIAQQGELRKSLADRLAALDEKLGVNLKESAAKTAEALGGLQERLKIIDDAQKNLTDLSGQVVTLQQILANKQTRGAYGQATMEAIIRDALPDGSYEFQAKLSNNKRPDCLIRLPGTKSAIVIDSKFPLECFELLKSATTEAERKAAMARVKDDVLKHVNKIAEDYLLVGETQDPAIMFVPSESVYAELHDSFPEVIQRAHRARVVVVSPNILMLAVNTVQTVLKDARMREQATLIQREVSELLRDVARLDDRVRKLQTHFGQAEDDMRQILISAEKVSRRGEKIEQVDVAPNEPPALPKA